MAYKPTKRKAFNFMRSYFDVLNEIPSKEDKLEFLLAVINKQFLDTDPVDMSFISKLSYESQRHSIEKSVKGYKDKMKTDLQGNPLIHPKEDPCKGLEEHPLKQEEEEEQEEVQVKEQEEVKRDVLYNIDKLISFYLRDNKLCNAFISNPDNKITSKQHLEKRLQEFKVNLTEQGRHSETWKEFTTYFRNWNKLVKKQSKVNNSNFNHKGFSL